MPKTIIFLLLAIFILPIQAFPANIFDSGLQDSRTSGPNYDIYEKKLTELKQESDNILKWNYLLKSLEKNINADQKIYREFILDIEGDLGFGNKKQGAVSIAVYHKVHGKIILQIKKYLYQNQFIYSINDIFISIKEIISDEKLNKAIKNNLNIDWLDFEVIPDRKSIKLGFNKDTAVEIDLDKDTLNRIDLIKQEMNDLLLDKKNLTDKKEEKSDSINIRWETTFRGPAPQDYLQDIEFEIRKAEKSKIIEEKLASFLQILKSLKTSGYIIPSPKQENILLSKINLLLDNKYEKEKLYDLLKTREGIKTILLSRFEKTIDKLDITNNFIKELNDYFLIKEEGEAEKFKNYYVKKIDFESIYSAIDKHLKQYDYKGPEWSKGKNLLIQELDIIMESSSRLAHKESVSKNLQRQYEKLLIKLRAVKEKLIKTDDTANIYTYTLEDILQYAFFGNILWESTVPEALPDDLLIHRGAGDIPINQDAFIYEKINNFFLKFSLTLFNYSGFGENYPNLFTRPWESMISHLNYKYFLKNPAVIENISSEHTTLLLNKYFFELLKKDSMSENKLISAGANLWSEIIIANAVLASVGIANEKLSLLMSMYILKVYTVDDFYAMNTYVNESEFNTFFSKERYDNGKIKLVVDKKISLENINDLFLLIFEFYNNYYKSTSYDIKKYFKEIKAG